VANRTFWVAPEKDGGLLCDSSGTPQKPFPSQPYCVQGTGTVSAVNLCGKPIAHCMTVLPGSESMLIPTTVTGTTVLAVNGPTYWAGTANQYVFSISLQPPPPRLVNDAGLADTREPPAA